MSLCSLTSTLSPARTSPSVLPLLLFPPPLSTLMSCALLPSHLPLASPCSSHRGYLVAAPSVFRAGVEESVSVTIFNAKAETRVQVQLTVKGQTVAHSHGSVLGENNAKVTLAQCITFREKTCTNKLSYETPTLCDLFKGCTEQTCWQKHRRIVKSTHNVSPIDLCPHCVLLPSYAFRRHYLRLEASVQPIPPATWCIQCVICLTAPLIDGACYTSEWHRDRLQLDFLLTQGEHLQANSTTV